LGNLGKDLAALLPVKIGNQVGGIVGVELLDGSRHHLRRQFLDDGVTRAFVKFGQRFNVEFLPSRLISEMRAGAFRAVMMSARSAAWISRRQ